MLAIPITPFSTHIIILVSVYPTASTVSNGPLAFNGNPHSENIPGIIC